MVLELKNIDKSFGEKQVLKGVSFTAEGGKVKKAKMKKPLLNR